MAQKQTIHGRMVQLSMVNIDAIIDASNEPHRTLRELSKAYTSVIADCEQLLTTKIGKLRLAEADHAEDVAAAIEWGQEARAALGLARDAESTDSLESHQLIALATYAGGKQASFQSWARQSSPHIAAQSERVKELKATLAVLQERLRTISSRLSEITDVDQATSCDESTRTATSINVFDPTSELSRFRERVHGIRRTMG